jgi:hypothetical protein
MNLLRRTAAIACVAALAACSSNPNLADEEARMERSRQVWNAQGIDDYRMIVWITGGLLGGGAVIEVRDGVPVSVQPAEGGPQHLPMSAFARYDTVEELFAVLEQAFDRNVHEVKAEYDPRFGLPIDVDIDPMRDAIDEEHGFSVEGFTVL